MKLSFPDLFQGSPQPSRRTALTGGAVLAAAAPGWSFAMPPVDLAIVELRQYTLHKGRRDELIALFEREFIAPQNALGAQVLGTFRDLDDPDRFVWLRGFSGMYARRSALESFYGGPVWQAHRNAANATMLDSDNVLLLKCARAGERLASSHQTPGLLRGSIHYLREVDPAAFTAVFETTLAPRVAACGGEIMARFVTEPGENTFSKLPVRLNDPVFVWFARFDSVEAERAFTHQLNAESGWRDGAPEAVLPAFMRKAEVLMLAPTDKSPLR